MYPPSGRERDRWIEARRGPRQPVNAARPFSFIQEIERSEAGELVEVATIFLTNRECPWRCVMCDLWKNTLETSVPVGAIPAQIDFALQQLPGARQIKLYNSGSFFDPGAIPPQDHSSIAARVSHFERVIVECHPALVNDSAVRFQAQIKGRLEVALGLECAHPEVLAQLNKRMTLDQFQHAAEFLTARNIALRVFVLVAPPFLGSAEQEVWVQRSIDFAMDCGATVVSLIPTREGNGAMEALRAQGLFSPPTLAGLEDALAYGLNLAQQRHTGGLRTDRVDESTAEPRRRVRVLADLWDLERLAECSKCFSTRRDRLQTMNRQQIVPPPVHCAECGRRLSHAS